MSKKSNGIINVKAACSLPEQPGLSRLSGKEPVADQWAAIEVTRTAAAPSTEVSMRLSRISPALLALLWVLVNAVVPLARAAAPGSGDHQAPGREMAQQATREAKRWITSDHSKHEALKQPFASGPEVTKACLSCHTEAAAQIHKSIHWTWVDPASPKDKPMGKGALTVNNF
jgi:hypothetical protein